MIFGWKKMTDGTPIKLINWKTPKEFKNVRESMDISMDFGNYFELWIRLPFMNESMKSPFLPFLNRHENDELPILFGRIRILIVSVDNEYAKFSRLINCFAIVRIADMITVNDCSLCNFWDAMSIALNNIQFLMPFFLSSSRRIISCVFSSLNRNHLEDNSLHDSLDEVNSLHAFWWCRQKRWAPCSLRKFSSLIVSEPRVMCKNISRF